MNKCKYRPQQEAVSTRFCSLCLGGGASQIRQMFSDNCRERIPKKKKLKKYKKPATERIDSGDNLLMDNILVIALISSGVSPQLCVCVCVCCSARFGGPRAVACFCGIIIDYALASY